MSEEEMTNEQVIDKVCPKCQGRSLQFDLVRKMVCCVKPSCKFEQRYMAYTEPEATMRRYLYPCIRISENEALNVLDVIVSLAEISLNDIAKVAKTKYKTDDDKAVARLNIMRVQKKLDTLLNHLNGSWYC